MSRGAWLPVLLALVCLLWSAPAEAYPWMIRHQQAACSTCHADPSGGGLLTAFGRTQAEQFLDMKWSEPAEDEIAIPNMYPLWGAIETPAWLLVGGAYRHGFLLKESGGTQTVATFPEQADLGAQILVGDFVAGGSLGIIKLPPGSPHSRAAQLTTAQGDDFNLISRTHFIGYNVGPGWQLRAGRLNLPFGLRIPEHTAWIRAATRTDSESDQQHGVALALTGARVRAEFMAILGNYQIAPDEFRERGYALYVEGVLGPTTAVGVSSLLTHSAGDLETLEQLETDRQSHGIFLRQAIGQPLVIMLELDTLVRSRRDLGYVGMLQLDLEIIQGLHLISTSEILDRGRVLRTGAAWTSGAATDGLGRASLRGGLAVDWFFLPQLEARVDAMTDSDDTQVLLGQLHLYL